MNITVEIKAPELATAILALAEALKGTSPVTPALSSQVAPVPESQQVNQPIAQQPINQPIYQAPPVQQPANVVPIQQAPVQQPMQQQAPMQQPPIQQPVPTTAPTYSMEQLAVAATQLMDAGRQADLIGLLGAFGAQSMMQLPKDQYGNFATKLRELGVNI